jgi:alkylhydroperoxidase family enzyme
MSTCARSIATLDRADREPDMAWIRLPRVQDATGQLGRLLQEAVARAGRVWGIVHVMSPNPPVLEASMALYRALMFGPGPLSRAERELVATVVSAEIRCVY